MAVGPPPPSSRNAAIQPGFCLRELAAQHRRAADSLNAAANELEIIAKTFFPLSEADDDDAV